LSPTILDSLTPSAGLREYRVTDGPIEISSISTEMLKFCKVLLIIFALAFMSPVSGLPRSFSRRVRGGGVKGRRCGTITEVAKSVSSSSVKI
jgi:hypothetical protein